MKNYFYFPIREFTSSTEKAVREINRLASDTRKSFCLTFDEASPERIRIQSCKGRIRRASFWLIERTSRIEDQVACFNELLSKNPIVLAVAIEDTVCITVVTED